ncbi:MAG: hypothetical protein DWB42_10665 [Chloroflexi bacterium]|nr:hypothetical protein [Chloroflexota bacterium]MDL1882993.1 hypothetical protein [Anaerolineae bacterium CFX8]GIL12991.1 MAG: hypothetical protein BroJett038_17110 [Chloroflexota bacterium]
MSDDSFKMNYSEGINVYQNARRRAFWQDVIGLLRNKPAELLSFDDIKTRLRLREESYKGLQDVPLDRIVGSVGRYRDFTSTFLPKSSTSQDRWSRVYAQVHSMEGVPPIELYKVDDVYFVRDGNHRVSVARQLGAKTIQAHVTELRTPVDLEPGMTREQLDAAAAYAAFLEETGLKNSRPHHQPMQLSEPSRYNDLMGHIYLHQNILEHTRGEGVTLEEAAADWYDNVYRPAVTLIRKYDVLSHMPKRTEADLYLWMVDHLREVRDEYGEDAPTRSFSKALEDFLVKSRLPVPDDLRQEDDDSVMLTRTQVMRAVALARAREEEAEGRQT